MTWEDFGEGAMAFLDGLCKGIGWSVIAVIVAYVVLVFRP